jgi:hypothetical protein
MVQEDPLRTALLRAYARWSTGSAAGYPQSGPWEPLAPAEGTGEIERKQRHTPRVPTGPTVPTASEGMAEVSPPLTADEEERAAILEFEGGLDRATAERLAQGRLPDWSGS